MHFMRFAEVRQGRAGSCLRRAGPGSRSRLAHRPGGSALAAPDPRVAGGPWAAVLSLQGDRGRAEEGLGPRLCRRGSEKGSRATPGDLAKPSNPSGWHSGTQTPSRPNAARAPLPARGTQGSPVLEASASTSPRPALVKESPF